jgi:hypothetical protein
MENSNYQRYTDEQRDFIVKTFYKTENNSETGRIFQEHFHRSIKRDTMACLIKRFEATISVKDLARPEGPRSICVEENTEGPQKSTRRPKQELGISRTSIQRMLHELKLKPYHPHLLHAVTDDDPDR